MHLDKSARLLRRAAAVMPGGVNSPVRAFKGVGGSPVFIESAQGAHLVDVDGNRYVDFVGAWGPMIHGHGFPPLVQAVARQAASGVGFGAPTEAEVEMAERLVARVPAIEKARLVNSGTEATMTALRLARGFTGRDLIVKFDGCYHGHSDALLVKAGSGALTLGMPDSAGVPAAVARDTLSLPYNDLAAVDAVLRRHGRAIACVIVEPVAGNMGCVPPVDGFLAGLREATDRVGALLVFDEVMTGFRVGPAGAGGRHGVDPDLVALGKVIGGGLPMAALGGRAEIMDKLAPDGPVYQAGTLSGNPLATAAGIAMLDALDDAFYTRLAATTQALTDGLEALARDREVPVCVNRVCGMFSIFFTAAAAVRGFTDVMACDRERYGQFFHAMLEAGVYFAPSAFEAAFVSAAHGEAEVAKTLAAADGAFARLNE